MAIDEAAFDSALADLMTTLDSTLNAIQEKLDAISEPADFTDEPATLDGAKNRLQEFVASNTPDAPTDPEQPSEPIQ